MSTTPILAPAPAAAPPPSSSDAYLPMDANAGPPARSSSQAPLLQAEHSPASLEAGRGSREPGRASREAAKKPFAWGGFVLLGCMALVMLAIYITYVFVLTRRGVLPANTLLISIDGFRWDYVDRGYSPNLAALALRGVRAQSLKPVYPSRTFPNHWSLVTGLLPESHGIVSNSFIDRGNLSARFAFNDPSLSSDPSWWGGQPIWNTAMLQGLRSAVYMWPGSAVRVGGMSPTHLQTYERGIANESATENVNGRVNKTLEWYSLPLKDRPQLVAVYFDLVDVIGHLFGPDSPQVNSAIQLVDKAIGEILAGLESRGLLSQMNVVVVSDHGMSQHSQAQVIFIDDYCKFDDLDVPDISPVALIYPEENVNVADQQRLLKSAPDVKVWQRHEIPSEYKYRNNPRIPPILAEPPLGWGMRWRIGFDPDRQLHGDHGWNNSLPDMQGIFFAAGPSFRQRTVVPQFDATEVYNILCEALDLDAAPNNGTLANVMGVFQLRF